MRIAIPTMNGKLSAHFGHCEAFTLIDVDTHKKEIIEENTVEAPPHEPGLLPPWLASQGASIIIAGGMGIRAQNLFAAQSIEVIVGAPVDTPDQIAHAYLDGSLDVGHNLCDH